MGGALDAAGALGVRLLVEAAGQQPGEVRGHVGGGDELAPGQGAPEGGEGADRRLVGAGGQGLERLGRGGHRERGVGSGVEGLRHPEQVTCRGGRQSSCAIGGEAGRGVDAEDPGHLERCAGMRAGQVHEMGREAVEDGATVPFSQLDPDRVDALAGEEETPGVARRRGVLEREGDREVAVLVRCQRAHRARGDVEQRACRPVVEGELERRPRRDARERAEGDLEAARVGDPAQVEAQVELSARVDPGRLGQKRDATPLLCGGGGARPRGAQGQEGGERRAQQLHVSSRLSTANPPGCRRNPRRR